MDQRQFRALFHGEVQAWATEHFPTLQVFYENGPDPDPDRVGDVWLDVSTRYDRAELLTMGDGFGAKGRKRGSLVTSCYYREGQGTDAVDEILVSLELRLRARHLGTATVLQPTPIVTGPKTMGWYRSGLMFPFYYDG